MTKPKMTYEEHVQFGRMLKDIRLMLFKADGEGGKSSIAARSAYAMSKKLEHVRNHFDNVSCRNYPEKWSAGIYYGE
jgi:hypothetical protein